MDVKKKSLEENNKLARYLATNYYLLGDSVVQLHATNEQTEYESDNCKSNGEGIT